MAGFLSLSTHGFTTTVLITGGGVTPAEGASVVEPHELFQLKYASHRYTADTNSTHFKRNNPLVCRISA
jgi:hypothetical protein